MRAAATAGCLLLATDTIFLLTNVFDWGPAALAHLVGMPDPRRQTKAGMDRGPVAIRVAHVTPHYFGASSYIGGGERHLSFRVRQSGTALRAVAFGMADRVDELMSAGGKCCLAFTPRLNDWNDYRNVEIEVADFQPGDTARLE